MRKIICLCIAVYLLLGFSAHATEHDVSDWAKNEIDEAIEIGFVPSQLQNNYTQNITREEFAYLTVSFVMENLSLSFEQLESQAEKYSAPRSKFEDSDNRYVLLAARLGIIKGVGNNLFDPVSPITREQAATMLKRTYCLYSYKQNQMQVLFDDSDQISEWAVSGVEFCVSYEVMKGVSNTHFAPQDHYTKEQAIVTFLRLYNIREWEEQNHKAQYKKIRSKEEVIESLTDVDTEYVATVVDNEYGTVVYLKHKLKASAERYTARHYLVHIANDGSIYPLNDGSPVLEKMSGDNPPIENITISDWGSVINYERVYKSSDFSPNSPDKPCDGILKVRIDIITRQYTSEFE